MENKELIYSYLAGFIEADGNVTVMNKNTRYPMLLIQVGQCRSEYPIQLLIKIFGGTYNISTSVSPITTAPCVYKWLATSEHAIEVINILMPYFKFRNNEFKEKVEYFKNNRINHSSKGRPRKHFIPTN